ncbi:MAG: helix-turn-helix domain-containing protein [Dehalococcoidia bacterium]|nr:helix-turn-helix domain-containing protein [Dehalococcoidia bacterium]
MAEVRRTQEDGPVWDVVWDADAVRALRAQLGLTQADLAERLGTRQQTVSEWETGTSEPRRMSRRLLRMVAEDAGFYDASPPPGDTADGPGTPGTPDTPDTPDRAAGARGRAAAGDGTEGARPSAARRRKRRPS